MQDIIKIFLQERLLLYLEENEEAPCWCHGGDGWLWLLLCPRLESSFIQLLLKFEEHHQYLTEGLVAQQWFLATSEKTPPQTAAFCVQIIISMALLIGASDQYLY